MATQLIKTGTDGNKYSIPTGRGMPPAEALRILLLIRDTLIFDDSGNLEQEGAITGSDAASAVWDILEENNLMPELISAQEEATPFHRLYPTTSARLYHTTSARQAAELVELHELAARAEGTYARPVEVQGQLGCTILGAAKHATEIARSNPGREYVLVFNGSRIEVTEEMGARVRPADEIAGEYMAGVMADHRAYATSEQAKQDEADRAERHRQAKERMAIAVAAVRKAPPGITRKLMIALRDYCTAACDTTPDLYHDSLFDLLRSRGFKKDDLAGTAPEILENDSELFGRYIIGQILAGFFHPTLVSIFCAWLAQNTHK